jgi:hypothetical protein
MRGLTITAGASLAGILIFTAPYFDQNPSQKVYSNIGIMLFAVLIFCASLFSLMLFWMRRKASGNELLQTHLGVSLRQGILLALCVVVLLVLQIFRVLTWWDGLLAVGAVMMMELYFLAR